jgi:hypothetical protein
VQAQTLTSNRPFSKPSLSSSRTFETRSNLGRRSRSVTSKITFLSALKTNTALDLYSRSTM